MYQRDVLRRRVLQHLRGCEPRRLLLSRFVVEVQQVSAAWSAATVWSTVFAESARPTFRPNSAPRYGKPLAQPLCAALTLRRYVLDR